MSPVPSTSALGLDLGLAPPFTAPSSSVSAKGAFAVESYTPTEGFAGILLTVNLTCFDTILPSINDQDQADDFRLIINDKKLCSRAEHGSNGNVTLRALLSTSLASLSGLVPMSLHLHRNGTLFDHCNFGYFNFVAVPMTTAPSSASVHNPSKRDRDDKGRTPSPESKRSRIIAPAPVSTYDSHQAKLIIESNIAELGDLSTWSPSEVRDRRRFVRLMRKQQRSIIHLRMVAISAEEVARDDRNVINCILPPDCGDEPSVSSVDIIKALELLVNPPDRRLSIEEKNRVRRNIDTLRPTTLKKGEEGLSWIMQLRSPRPITIAKDVKIFKWSSLEAALTKIMKKYSYQNDGSLVEQRNSPILDEASIPQLTSARQQFDEATANPNKTETRTPPVAASRPASPEAMLAVPTILDSLSASLALVAAPPLTRGCFDVQQSEQADALLGVNPNLFNLNLLEPPSSLDFASTASLSSDSTLSSGSSLGLGLITPAEENIGEYFDVENGCGPSLNGPEYLSHADLEALFSMPILGTDAGLEGRGPAVVENSEILAAAEFETFLGGIFTSDDTSVSCGINQWNFGSPAPTSSDLDASNYINSHLF